MGDHIRRRRLILAITQEEAGALLKVNTWTVHNWETGQRKPEIRFIQALVAFLGYGPESVEEETLAGRLVAKRRQLGLSQLHAARSIGVDPATWAGWEIGVTIMREAHRKTVEGFLEMLDTQDHNPRVALVITKKDSGASLMQLCSVLAAEGEISV